MDYPRNLTHCKKLGRAIKRERRRLGLTQQKLAELAGGGISDAGVRAIEHGNYKHIVPRTYENALRLCEVLNLDFATCKKKPAAKCGGNATGITLSTQLDRVKYLAALLDEEIIALEKMQAKAQAANNKQPSQITPSAQDSTGAAVQGVLQF